MLTDTRNDNEILTASIREPNAFSVLIDRYQEAFLRKSTAIVHSREEAEDIVQDTFLKIYRNNHKFKGQDGASFKSWAYQILRNTCYTYYVKNKKYRSETKLVDFSERDFEDVEVKQEEMREETVKKVRFTLSLLPKSLVTVLRLYFLEEKSQKEIAEAEHISTGAVRARIHRAKKILKEYNLHTI